MAKSKDKTITPTTYDILINKDGNPYLGQYISDKGNKKYGETEIFYIICDKSHSEFKQKTTIAEKENLIDSIRRTFSWGGRRFIKADKATPSGNEVEWKELGQDESNNMISRLMKSEKIEAVKPLEEQKPKRYKRHFPPQFTERVGKRTRSTPDEVFSHTAITTANSSQVARPDNVLSIAYSPPSNSYTDLVERNRPRAVSYTSHSSASSSDRGISSTPIANSVLSSNFVPTPSFKDTIRRGNSYNSMIASPEAVLTESLHDDALYDIFSSGGEAFNFENDTIEYSSKQSRSI